MSNDSFHKFGYTFQVKIITSLITDVSFLQQISDMLNIDYFESDSNKWLVNCIMEYFVKHKSQPTMEVFRAEVADIDNDTLKAAIIESLKDVYRYIESADLDFVKEKTIDFCKNKCIKNAILDSVPLLDLGNYDGIKTLIDSAMKAGADKEIGHEYNTQIQERYTESVRKTVLTPWPVLNDLTDGGLGRGELGVFVAPAGIGKSWALINIGADAIKNGKNVIHYTLELSEAYVGLRYDSVMTGIPAQNLKHHQDDVEKIINQVPGNLVIKYYPTKGARVNTLRVHIEKSIALGQPPDIIILDYADLLRSDHKGEKRHELETIYEDIRGLAGEYNIPLWTASQANRSSLEEQEITAMNVAESYAKVMIADFIISLSRKVEDKIAGTGRWHVIKNRFGPDGLTFPSDMNTSNGQIKIHERTTVEGRTASEKMENQSEYARQILSQKFKELL